MATIAHRMRQLILNRPGLVVAALVIATLLFVPGIFLIHINNDLKAGLPRDSAIQKAMQHIDDTFGGSETIIVSVTTPQGVFDQQALTLIYDLTGTLERTAGVARIRTLANVDYADKDAEGAMNIHALIEDAPADVSAVATIERQATEDPMLARAFISTDRRSTSLYIDARREVTDEQVLAALAEQLDKLPQGYSYVLGGMPVMRHYTTIAVRQDMLRLMPLIFVVLTIVLAWSLRSLHGVLITQSLVALSILPSAGLMGFFGAELTAGNNMFPILILATSCADSIHVLSMFYAQLREGKTSRQAVEKILNELWLPVFLTSATTAIGFLTLVTSAIPPIRSLGYIVAAGVTWAWVLSCFGLPAALLLVRPPKSAQATEQSHVSLPAVQRLAVRHPAWGFLIVGLAVAVPAAIFIPRVVIEPRFEKQFPEDHPVRIAQEAIDADYGGVNPIELVIHSDPRDPTVLGAVYALEQELATLPQVGGTDSVAQLVARVNERLTGTRAIPDNPDMLAQAILLASMQGDPNTFERFVSKDLSEFRLTIRLPSLPEAELRPLIADIEARVARQLPAGLKYDHTGKALFDLEIADLMIDSAAQSIVLSMLLCALICGWMVRSVVVGIFSIFPIGLAIAANFTLMGMLGIGMSVAVAIVFSIVIGVGVDYAIHFLTRWKIEHDIAEANPGLDTLQRFEVILRTTMEDVGGPVIFNAIAVALGLGVLIFSNFDPVRNLGVLAASSMLSTSFAALVVLPLLKRTLYRAGAKPSE